MAQEIHKSFDCIPPGDGRGVFLDISKALKNMVLKKKILYSYGELFKNRNRRVVLNRLNSSWKKNTSRGSTGISVGTTSLPHIFINDLLSLYLQSVKCLLTTLYFFQK